MHYCLIEIGEWCVVLESTRDLSRTLKHLATSPMFLGIKVLPNVSSGKYRVLYKEQDDIVVKYSRRTLFVGAPWETIRNGETLLYAALPFIELQHQQNGFVTAHAAAVAFPEGAILLLGKEGSGKTTTALGLCREYGARLIGNDLVIIGVEHPSQRIIIRSGTKFLSLRYESIHRNMPDLLPLFPQGDEDPWLHKVLVSAEQVGITTHEGSMPLIKSFMVHVDETKKSLLVKSADTVITRLYLNENFSRYIRGTCIALLGARLEYLGYIPSLDTNALFTKRVVLMQRLLIEHSMMYVSGPLGKVVDYIAS